jgi:hypothetical protein
MIRAIAVATDTSDLVGTVELACEPDGLSLAFVRASAYAAAFAPTPPAAGRRIVVPWAHVKEAWDDGETLRIALDSPRVPHHRLVLAHLTRDLEMTHDRVHRGRRETQWLIAGGSALLMAVAWPLLAQVGGAVALLSGLVLTFGVVTGAVAIASSLGRNALVGGPDQAAVRRAFFEQIRRHLPKTAIRADEALSPTPAVSAAPPPLVEAPTPLFARFGELGSALLAAGATAVIALLVVSVSGRFMTGTDQAPRDEASARPATAIAPSALPTVVPPPAPAFETLEPCTCQYPASPAIPTRVPRVSLLSTVLRQNRDPRRPSLSVEVAAVNNGATPLKDVTGAVTFLTPGARPEEPMRVRGEKGIYYEGPLAPGAAVKWRVGGRGIEYRAAVTTDDVLDDDGTAPADAFAALLSAHTRSVRMHAAAMLAKKRDERARGAIEKLREDARSDEAPVLASLERAVAPVFACDLELTQEGASAGVSACVMNTGDAPTSPLSARVSVSRRGPVGEDVASQLADAVLGRAFILPARAGGRVRGTAMIPASIKDVDVEVRVEEGVR